MRKSFKRTDRIAALIQRELAQIISKEIRDDRLTGFITLSAVKVTADLAHAKVYFTVFQEDKKLAVTVLNDAASHLRGILARTVLLRTVPELRFVYDESIEYGQHLSHLIDKANPPTSDDTDD